LVHFFAENAQESLRALSELGFPCPSSPLTTSASFDQRQAFDKRLGALKLAADTVKHGADQAPGAGNTLVDDRQPAAPEISARETLRQSSRAAKSDWPISHLQTLVAASDIAIKGFFPNIWRDWEVASHYGPRRYECPRSTVKEPQDAFA